jgi:DNA-binding NtrC family response regulator
MTSRTSASCSRSRSKAWRSRRVRARPTQAKRELTNGELDLCLTDMRLPDGDGLDLVDWMQTHAEGVPVAVITAHGNVESPFRRSSLAPSTSSPSRSTCRHCAGS